MLRRVVTALMGGALLTLLVAAPTVQAAPKSAQVITVIGSNAILAIDDENVPGPSPGDVRTLSLSLANAKGQPAGRADIVQTLTRQDGNVGTALKVVELTLPKGTITAMGLTEFTNFTDPQGRPNDETEQIAIVGGTGAFVGAKGSIDIVVLPDFASKWVIRISR